MYWYAKAVSHLGPTVPYCHVVETFVVLTQSVFDTITRLCLYDIILVKLKASYYFPIAHLLRICDALRIVHYTIDSSTS